MLAMTDRVVVERCRRFTEGAGAPPELPHVGWGAAEPIGVLLARGGHRRFAAWLATRAERLAAEVAADRPAAAARLLRWEVAAAQHPIAAALLALRSACEVPVTAELLSATRVGWERAGDRLTVASGDPFACLSGPCASAEVQLSQGPLEVTCAASKRPCRLKQLAVERLLELIASPRAGEEEARAHLVAPVWEQLLGRLRHAGEVAVEGQLGWLLKTETDVVLCRVEPKKGGGWKAKVLTQAEVLDIELSDARDALVVALLEHKIASFERERAHRDRVSRVLAALVGRGEVFAKIEREIVRVEVRRVDPEIVVGDGPETTVSVRWGDASVPAREAPTAGAWAYKLDAAERVIRVGHWSRAAVRAWSILQDAPSLPDAAKPALAETLLVVSRDVAVKRDVAWLGEGHRPAPDVVFRLSFSGPRGVRVLALEGRVRPVPELGALLPGHGEPIVAVRRAGRVGHVVRALDDEGKAVDAVALAIGLELDHEASGPARYDWIVAGLERAMATWTALQAHALVHPQIQLAWQTREPDVQLASARSLHLRLGVRRDWLDIEGGLGLDGAELPLRELLQALCDKKRFVEVAGDRLVEIGQVLARELAPLAALERVGGGDKGLRASRYAAPLVAELEAAGAVVDGPPEWLAATERLAEAAALEVPIPSGLRAELRPYQADGVVWLARLAHWARGACLADDMGLGKTLQALALLLHRAPIGRALIVAPTSVVPNWLREAERFTPGLPMASIARGADLGRLDESATIVTSWDLLVRHQARFAAVSWATVVFDEAHAVKNAATRRAQVARALPSGFVVALTGTPVENRPSELWSLFQVIAPGLLGSAESFRETFARQIELGQSAPAERLARLVRPFLLRRKKVDVAAELPPKSEVRVDVVLSSDERDRYERVRRSAMAALRKNERGTKVAPSETMLRVLVVLMRLRQLACHPRLVDPSAPEQSAKLERLVELVDELRAEGRKVLVFSQFTELLALVRVAFEAAEISYAYLDGGTPSERRVAAVDRFQAGEVDAFVLSLKAGGSGLNLTTATEVIHLDPWWNPAVEDQASDRAHRIGQDRPVTIYRMVALGTIEEQILGLHQDKRAMVASVLEGTSAAQVVTVDELLALIASEPVGSDQ